MIEELDIVSLKRDRADLGLKAGDEGAVVLVYGDEACEVEFVNPDGSTRVMTALPMGEIEVVWRIADHRTGKADRRAAG
jgi:hypothetical protein